MNYNLKSQVCTVLILLSLTLSATAGDKLKLSKMTLKEDVLSPKAPPRAYFKSNRALVIDGSEFQQSFWTGSFDAGNKFDSNPVAYAFYQKHRKWGRWFGILNWSALAGVLIYSISTNSSSYNSGTAAGIFFIPWLSGVYAGFQSGKYMIKAVNVYNGVPASQSLHHHLQDKFDGGGILKMPPVVNLKWNF